MSLFKPICKYCATVTSVRSIVPTVCRALQMAQSGTPGKYIVLLKRAYTQQTHTYTHTRLHPNVLKLKLFSKDLT